MTQAGVRRKHTSVCLSLTTQCGNIGKVIAALTDTRGHAHTNTHHPR